MSLWWQVWRTKEECEFLSAMAKKVDGAAKLAGYLAAAENRVEWGDIEPWVVKAYARMLLKQGQGVIR